jgi:hypothetical protein
MASTSELLQGLSDEEVGRAIKQIFSDKNLAYYYHDLLLQVIGQPAQDEEQQSKASVETLTIDQLRAEMLRILSENPRPYRLTELLEKIGYYNYEIGHELMMELLDNQTLALTGRREVVLSQKKRWELEQTQEQEGFEYIQAVFFEQDLPDVLRQDILFGMIDTLVNLEISAENAINLKKLIAHYLENRSIQPNQSSQETTEYQKVMEILKSLETMRLGIVLYVIENLEDDFFSPSETYEIYTTAEIVMAEYGQEQEDLEES